MDPSVDPVLEGFLARVPDAIRRTFSPMQVAALKAAFGAESRAGHALDLRLSLPLPGARRRVYCVILAGRDRRWRPSTAMRRARRALRLILPVTAYLAAAALFAVLVAVPMLSGP